MHQARRAEDQTPALVCLMLFGFKEVINCLAINKAQEKWEPSGRLRVGLSTHSMKELTN